MIEEVNEKYQTQLDELNVRRDKSLRAIQGKE